MVTLLFLLEIPQLISFLNRQLALVHNNQMKNNLIKIGLMFPACFLVIQASQALAQAAATTNYSTIQWSQISSNDLAALVKKANPSKIPANAWGIILKKVDWFQLPTNI